MQGKIFRVHARMLAIALLLAALCFHGAVSFVSAADEKVISATVDSENIYVKNVSDLPVLGESDASTEADEEKEESLLADVPIIFFAIGGSAIFFIILMIIIVFVAVSRKKVQRRAEADAAMQWQMRDTVGTGDPLKTQGNTGTDQTAVTDRGAKGNNTISLKWPRQQVNTYLVLRDNARPASMFKVLIRDVIRIGRKDADIVIDYDKYISAKQCEIIKRGTLLYIKDLGSVNGTYYENVRVYDQEIPVVSGGTIQMGRSKFTVTIVTE